MITLPPSSTSSAVRYSITAEIKTESSTETFLKGSNYKENINIIHAKTLSTATITLKQRMYLL